MLHGLAWETVAPIVGTKDATSCRLFFSEYLASPLASASSSSSFAAIADGNPSKPGPTILTASGPDGLAVVDVHQEDIPRSLVEMAETDAVAWASKVRSWRKRRQQGRTGLLFAVVDGSIVRLPDSTAFTRHNANQCSHCTKVFTTADKMRCVVCEDAFHTACALKIDPTASSTPKDEWYCPTCLDDEKYVYEDSCWGQSGKLLCAMADRLEGSAGSTVSDWEFNSQIIAEATRMAQAIVRQQGGDTLSESADSRAGPKRPASGSTGERKRAKGGDGDEEDSKKKLSKRLKEAMEEVNKLREENKNLRQDLQKVTAERDTLKRRLEDAMPNEPDEPLGAETSDFAASNGDLDH